MTAHLLVPDELPPPRQTTPPTASEGPRRTRPRPTARRIEPVADRQRRHDTRARARVCHKWSTDKSVRARARTHAIKNGASPEQQKEEREYVNVCTCERDEAINIRHRLCAPLFHRTTTVVPHFPRPLSDRPTDAPRRRPAPRRRAAGSCGREAPRRRPGRRRGGAAPLVARRRRPLAAEQQVLDNVALAQIGVVQLLLCLLLLRLRLRLLCLLRPRFTTSAPRQVCDGRQRRRQRQPMGDEMRPPTGSVLLEGVRVDHCADREATPQQAAATCHHEAGWPGVGSTGAQERRAQGWFVPVQLCMSCYE